MKETSENFNSRKQVVSIIITNFKSHNTQTKTSKLKSYREINDSIVVCLGSEIKIRCGGDEKYMKISILETVSMSIDT